MNAEIAVKFTIKDVCSEQDLKDLNINLAEMVQLILNEEGIWGIIEDDYEILWTKEIDYHKH